MSQYSFLPLAKIQQIVSGVSGNYDKQMTERSEYGETLRSQRIFNPIVNEILSAINNVGEHLTSQSRKIKDTPTMADDEKIADAADDPQRVEKLKEAVINHVLSELKLEGLEPTMDEKINTFIQAASERYPDLSDITFNESKDIQKELMSIVKPAPPSAEPPSEAPPSESKEFQIGIIRSLEGATGNLIESSRTLKLQSQGTSNVSQPFPIPLLSAIPYEKISAKGAFAIQSLSDGSQLKVSRVGDAVDIEYKGAEEKEFKNIYPRILDYKLLVPIMRKGLSSSHSNGGPLVPREKEYGSVLFTESKNRDDILKAIENNIRSRSLMDDLGIVFGVPNIRETQAYINSNRAYEELINKLKTATGRPNISEFLRSINSNIAQNPSTLEKVVIPRGEVPISTRHKRSSSASQILEEVRSRTEPPILKGKKPTTPPITEESTPPTLVAEGFGKKKNKQTKRAELFRIAQGYGYMKPYSKSTRQALENYLSREMNKKDKIARLSIEAGNDPEVSPDMMAQFAKELSLKRRLTKKEREAYPKILKKLSGSGLLAKKRMRELLVAKGLD